MEPIDVQRHRDMSSESLLLHLAAHLQRGGDNGGHKFRVCGSLREGYYCGRYWQRANCCAGHKNGMRVRWRALNSVGRIHLYPGNSELDEFWTKLPVQGDEWRAKHYGTELESTANKVPLRLGHVNSDVTKV
jgi:hypothetical protein